MSTHEQILRRQKQWGNFLCENTQEYTAMWWTTHRHILCKATRLYVMETPEKHDTIPKFCYKNLIINLVSHFWNLFLAPTYIAWETSVLIVTRSQRRNSKPSVIRWSVFRILLCPQDLLSTAQGLAVHLNCFEHTFHSSCYLTSKCLTFHVQKLDNTIKCQWSCEDH